MKKKRKNGGADKEPGHGRTVEQGGGPVIPSEIEHWPIDRLIPYARNARTHTQAQVAEIAGSIREFGWTNPVLADENGDIIAGHGRVEAARMLSMTHVPVIVLKHLTAAQKRALRIADNKIALNSGWDEELLRLELTELRDAGFDARTSGFSEKELAALLSNVTVGKTDPDETPEIPEKPVSVVGDLWLCGRHRIICGDATNPEVVAKVTAGVEASLMVTDPPYGVEYDPEWRIKALKKPRGAFALGKVKNDDNPSWRAVYRLFTGPVCYVWHASRYASVVEYDLADLTCDVSSDGTHVFDGKRCKLCNAPKGMEVRAQIIWRKDIPVISRGHYHWQHEPCFYAVRRGETANWQGGTKQTTVWDIQKQSKNETGHSTQKPVECMKRPIENHTSPGQAVYDPFVGSGTTIIACEMIGRCAIAVEIEPAYVDVAVTRWQDFVGQDAIHAETGKTFKEMAAERG
jgi:DNA modification methylase